MTNIAKITDRLVEISRENLPTLKSLYISNGKKNYVSFMAIDNYIRWFEQDPSLKHVKIYSLNGDFSDGTFIITVNKK